MDLRNAEAQFRAAGPWQRLAYCKEFLVRLLVQPRRVLCDAVVSCGEALDEPLVEDPKVHGGPAEGGEPEIPRPRYGGGDARGEGGGVGFVGLVDGRGIGGAHHAENAGRHGACRRKCVSLLRRQREVTATSEVC